MAVAVPLLLANTAAGMAIAGTIGVTVGTLATVTAVAFQVTGINDKINKAASKVFGEDLVQVANLAGMAYSGFNGGWQSEGLSGMLGGAEVAAGGADVASVADKAFDADWAKATGGMEMPSGVTSPGNVFDKITPQASTTASTTASTAAAETGVQNVATNGPGMQDMKPTAAPAAPAAAVEPVSKYAIAPNAAGTSAAARTSTGLNAADSNATSGLGLKASGDALAPQQGFFDRLIANTGDKTIAGLVQGAAQGYSAAQASKTAEQRAAEEQRRYYSTPTFKVNPYKAPA